MWSKWMSLTAIQRSQYVLAALVVMVFAGEAVQSWSDRRKPAIVEAANVEMPAEGGMDAAAVPYDASPEVPLTSTPAAGSSAAKVPPTAVVDGVTYTGEEQIEALTQAARDAGLSEAEARRTGEEAAILCNGNPDCLR